MTLEPGILHGVVAITISDFLFELHREPNKRMCNNFWGEHVFLVIKDVVLFLYYTTNYLEP